MLLRERIAGRRRGLGSDRASSRRGRERSFGWKTPSRGGHRPHRANDEFFAIELVGDGDLWQLAENLRPPALPPRSPAAAGGGRNLLPDGHAREPGAVAAPTAGLHFDDDLFARLRELGVAPPSHAASAPAFPARAGRAHRRPPHAQRTLRYPPPPPRKPSRPPDNRRPRDRRRHHQSARLESAAHADGGVRPGLRKPRSSSRRATASAWWFRLVTNFHLPKSTLLMLVSAFAGYDTIRAAYAHAVAQGLPLLPLRRRHVS